MLLNPLRRRRRHALRDSRKYVQGVNRAAGIEQMEPRLLLSVAPVHVGAVYIEEDLGSDLHGDVIEVSFEGGAPGTQLDRIVIDGDQNDVGFNVGDVFFDTNDAALGADFSFPFSVISQNGIDRVTASVDDGTTRLTLDFEGFEAGEVLRFSIDVDEVEFLDASQTDLMLINDGFDPITSGVEFQSSSLSATLSAPNFETANANSTFINRYDDVFDGTDLKLPPDDIDGKRDRTAGAVAQVQQQPIPVSISGHVFHDRDQDGQRDSGEEPIGGVSIRAIPIETVVQQDAVIAVTDEAGFYEFQDLMPGSYQLVEVAQPAGYLDGIDAAGTVDGQRSGTAINPGDMIDDIFLPGGSVGVDFDFGEILPVSLSGQVHLANSDGDCFSDTVEHRPIANAVVRLEDQDGRVIAETLTDEQGRYEFLDLTPGVYSIIEETPDGLIDGAAQAGTVAGLTRGFVDGRGRISQIELVSGENGVSFDFCEEEPVSISGNVHLSDVDGDCFAESITERPLADVLVQLLDEAGRIVASTRTDAAGNYQFLDLLPGDYSVVEQTPELLFDGAAHVGLIDGEIVGQVLDAGQITGIRLNSGQQATHYDFCEHPPSRISGVVYHDRNNDGQRASSEEGIGDARVILMDAAGRTVATTQTDAAGQYEFSGLAAGQYAIREEQPTGWADGIDTPGTVSGRPEGVAENPGDRISQITLQWGEAGTEFNFGELLAASIGGIVHLDLNADCQQQEGESPLAGIRVELLDQSGRVIDSMLTAADGRFLFTDLAPGVYTLREIQPDEYFHGGQRAGTGGGDDQQPDLISDIVVGSGDVWVDYAFCEEPPSAISGYVFQDGPVIQLQTGESLPDDIATIRDGQLTPDDRRLKDVVLELRDGVTGLPIFASANALPGAYPDGPITTTTDASGFYLFQGLRKGNYAIYEIQPEGFIDGVDTEGTLPSVAINRFEEIEPTILASLKKDPNFDAIVRLALPPGQFSRQNNFSEVIADRTPIVPFDGPAPVPPPPPIEILIPVIEPPRPPDLELLNYEIPGYGYVQSAWANTWHLSVIDGGSPRGEGELVSARGPIWLDDGRYEIAWSNDAAHAMKWTLLVQDGETLERVFGVQHGIPVTGDFNGDGFTEIGVFAEGQWFIDLNGDGTWDENDLWAQLGHQGDIPVTGDWDGDGKHDIGIYGLAWPGDPRAIGASPVCRIGTACRMAKRRTCRAMTMTIPCRASAHSNVRLRAKRVRTISITSFTMERLATIPSRAIGTATVLPRLAYSKKANGISIEMATEISRTSISRRQFGAVGDIPVVGDFNGDGVDEIGVYRGTQFIMDTNRNHRIDDGDKVVSAPRGKPVVGDWDGDGVDDVGVVEEPLRFAEIDPR